jgi:hypothetical protein
MLRTSKQGLEFEAYGVLNTLYLSGPPRPGTRCLRTSLVPAALTRLTLDPHGYQMVTKRDRTFVGAELSAPSEPLLAGCQPEA